MAENKLKKNLNKVFKKGKALIIAYDQGLEHGPESDFNDKNVDPLYIIDIAKHGKFSALALGKGLSEKYNKEIRESKIPLIVKLNGKTKIPQGEPISEKTGTVKEAIKFGAIGVGFTIYLGSANEPKMIKEFSEIEKEAHENGLLVMLWVYPRGKAVKNDISREMISYSARFGLELGADIVKLKYGGNVSDLSWAVKSAGRTKVVVSGGSKENEKDFIKEVKDVIKAGASGMAIGRNIWQDKNPLEITKKIKKIIWS
jgi:class I fructose-bisphosphate aldolase